MLCTKSPNRFRYADSFDGEFVGVSVELSLTEDIGAKDFPEPRERSPSAETGEAIPEACALTSATDATTE